MQENRIDGLSSCAALQDTLDLQLLQHFTLDVSRSLAEESKDITLWQRLVPSIAFEHAFVMHGLLALSALSYARHNLSLKTKCIARAQTHHARTLHKFIPELNNPDNANTDALYVTSVLLSFHHFAKGPRSGEYLVFGDQGQPEWLWLLGGVRTILDSEAGSLLKSSTLSTPTIAVFHQSCSYSMFMSLLWNTQNCCSGSDDSYMIRP